MNPQTIAALLKVLEERVNEIRSVRPAIKSAGLLTTSVEIAISNEVDRLQRLGVELEALMSVH